MPAKKPPEPPPPAYYNLPEFALAGHEQRHYWDNLARVPAPETGWYDQVMLRWTLEEGDIDVTPGSQDHGYRLTTDQERAAFEAMNYATHRATRAEQRERVAEQALWQQRALDGRNLLVQANLRLVLWAARHSRARNIPKDDLILEGQLALIEIVPLFDYRRGIKFSTYATTALHNRFICAGRSRSRDDRHCFRDTDSAGNPAAETARTGWSESACKYLAAPDVRAVWCEEDRMIPLVTAMVHNGVLTARERRVITARFLQAEPLALAALGQEFGVSRERVRQIQTLALERLRVAALACFPDLKDVDFMREERTSHLHRWRHNRIPPSTKGQP